MSDVAYTVTLNYAKDSFTQRMLSEAVDYDLTGTSASSGVMTLLEDDPQIWPSGDVDAVGRVAVKNLDATATVHIGEWLGDDSDDGSPTDYFATWSTVLPGHVVMLEPPSTPYLLAVGGSARIIFVTLPV